MSSKLSPTDPPGRRTRKARAYWTDIQRLRAQGYTFEAIRAALAAVGVDVSNRTVQREAARPSDVRDDATNALEHVAQSRQQSGCSAAEPDLTSEAEPSQSASSLLPAKRRGKDVAEAFRRSRCANPLIRAKEQS